MKNVAIIGTVGLPAKYGGFETLAANLVKHLDYKYKFTVYCSQKRYSKSKRQRSYLNANLVYLPFDANGIQSILYDSLSILHALFFAEVLLILGVSGAWILPFVRLFTRKKIIISIDGIEWKRDKWNLFAKCYLWWAEKIAIRYSHIDISDNESIQDYTAKRYKSLSRVIEYGADHALKVDPEEKDLKKYPFLASPYAFKVCRIEPENKIGEILNAFSQYPELDIVIVGNWENSLFGQKLRDRYQHFPNIFLLNPIYDQVKLDVLRSNAYLYVHGHSAGGTNPSLVEAMYLGLPVIAYGVSYNRSTTEGKAIYFHSANELIRILASITSAELTDIAEKMHVIARRKYTWQNIAQRYDQLILEVFQTENKQNVAPDMSNLPPYILSHYKVSHLQHQNLFFEYEE